MLVGIFDTATIDGFGQTLNTHGLLGDNPTKMAFSESRSAINTTAGIRYPRKNLVTTCPLDNQHEDISPRLSNADRNMLISIHRTVCFP